MANNKMTTERLRGNQYIICQKKAVKYFKIDVFL